MIQKNILQKIKENLLMDVSRVMVMGINQSDYLFYQKVHGSF